MFSNQPFGFEHPNKKQLEHLLSVRGDLERADEALSSLIDRAALFGGGGLLAEAVFTLAIVTYVRCFASGRRKGLSSSIYKDKPRLLKAHEDFKSIRDKHIAHAVGLLENLHVLVAAASPSSPAIGVGSLGVSFSHTQKRSSLLLLRQAARFALSSVDRDIEILGSRLATDILGRQTTWKQSQKSFYAAIGKTGFVNSSAKIEAKVLEGAPSAIRVKRGISRRVI